MNPVPSLLQKILLQTDGTVTDLLRLFTGENIVIEKLSERSITSLGPSALGLAEPTELLQRQILLTGSKPYLYAESYFVLERLPTDLRQQMLNSNTPVGLLWQQYKLETYREIIDQQLEKNCSNAQHFALTDNRCYSRTYLIHHGGQVMGQICEQFPVSYFSTP